MKNQYPGICAVCQRSVGPGEGHYEKIKGQGVVLCEEHHEQHFKPRITITVLGRQAFVRPAGFLGDSFSKFTTATRAAGCKYDPASKGNACSPDALSRVILELQKSGFVVDVSDDAKQILASKIEQVQQDVGAATARLEAVNEGLAKRGLRLYDYQIEGVRWLAPRSRALLADAPGVGKTAQSLISVPEGQPIVVVCPAVVKGVWVAETKKWRPDIKQISVMKGRGSFRWAASGEILITNYDVLPADIVEKKGVASTPAEPLEMPPQGTVLIADEAHALKDPKAKRTRAFRRMAGLVLKQGGRVWLLTGTPLVNRPPELWSVLQQADLANEAYGNFNTFASMFSGYKTRWGTEWGTPKPEAAERLKRVMLRRTKDDVLKDLPPKSYQNIVVDIDDKYHREIAKVLKESGQTAEQVMAAVEQAIANNRMPRFEEMSRVSEVLSRAKYAALSELIDQYEDAGEPILVFDTHLWPVQQIASSRKGWGLITGADTPAEERTKIVSDFQSGKLNGVALTIRAGGVGITLHRAKTAIFSSSSFSPADNEQAEDRIHRVGQDRGVTIVRLIANHPLDARVMELLDQKRGIILGSVEAARTKLGEAPVDPAESYATALEAAETVSAEAREHTEALKQIARKATEARRSRTLQTTATSETITNAPHPPRTSRERWVAEGLMTLAALDPDRASKENLVGFNSTDGEFGHSLASRVALSGELTPRQWVFATKLVKKYHRQIGQMPAAESDDYALVNPTDE